MNDTRLDQRASGVLANGDRNLKISAAVATIALETGRPAQFSQLFVAAAAAAAVVLSASVTIHPATRLNPSYHQH